MLQFCCCIKGVDTLGFQKLNMAQIKIANVICLSYIFFVLIHFQHCTCIGIVKSTIIESLLSKLSPAICMAGLICVYWWHKVCELVAKLEVNLSLNEIATAHRIGRPLLNKSRPILCKFISKDVKFRVMVNRKNMKGKAEFNIYERRFDRDQNKEEG